MLRVLHCVNNMHRAGLETMLMNYYRNIDRTRIQFDFLTHRPYRSDYDDEIESLGGNVYYAPRLYPKNYLAYFSYMKDFFASHPEYKIVHSHIDSMSYLPLLAAKKSQIPIRIAHSHNTAIDLDFKYPLKQIFKMNICTVATNYLACGAEAGRFLFKNKEFGIVPNAIDADKFCFCDAAREAKRAELALDGAFVVGNIGRFSYQKNHEFLLKVFSEVLKFEPSAVLLLVGTGENEEKIKSQAKKLGIYEKVCFAGTRSDVSSLYSAMDVLVMPSRFEGVPVVGIEAQFSGLPCVFSNKVPREVAFTDGCTFLDLKIGVTAWADTVINFGKNGRKCEPFPESVYRIENATECLERYYLNLLSERSINI